MEAERLTWRKSSWSGDNGGGCVEVAWRKSSRSGGNGGGCVEVATVPDRVMIRDSKDVDGPVLSVTLAEWRRFVAEINR